MQEQNDSRLEFVTNFFPSDTPKRLGIETQAQADERTRQWLQLFIQGPPKVANVSDAFSLASLLAQGAIGLYRELK